MEDSKTGHFSELALQTVEFLSRCLLFVSNLSSHPLFSIFTASTLLALLYLPHSFLPFVFSPVPLSTFVLLAALLRRGSPAPVPEIPAPQPEPKISYKGEMEQQHQNAIVVAGFLDRSFHGGPLEVIYEEYEGEEEEHSPGWLKGVNFSPGELRAMGFEYTDSDSESEGSPMAATANKVVFRLDDEEEDEELIEIELEEENLIEIDISGGCR